MNPTTTIWASVLTSSGVAAIVTGVLSGRNERRRLLREQRIKVAGDYASDAMESLARMRDYKPTIGNGHRNEVLHSDHALRDERATAIDLAIDRLRPQRGRVFVTFPGRSSRVESRRRGPLTTADWAERTIGALRSLKETCDAFWEASDLATDDRAEVEKKFDAEYQRYQEETWMAIDRFAESAAKQLA